MSAAGSALAAFFAYLAARAAGKQAADASRHASAAAQQAATARYEVGVRVRPWISIAMQHGHRRVQAKLENLGLAPATDVKVSIECFSGSNLLAAEPAGNMTVALLPGQHIVAHCIVPLDRITPAPELASVPDCRVVVRAEYGGVPGKTGISQTTWLLKPDLTEISNIVVQ